MKYTDTEGNEVDGEVFAAGPRASTVWVVRPDRTATLVKVGNKTVKTKDANGKEVKTTVAVREETPYPLPEYCPPLPAAGVKAAQEVIDRYREAIEELRELGVLHPIGEDYKAARMVLDYHEKAQKSRTPFIEQHAPASVTEFSDKGEAKQTSASVSMSVSLARLKELSQEE